LRNVTLHLPEGYELIVGTRTENVHIYYELAKVPLVANARSIKLIVGVTLKTTNFHFDLYRIVLLPQCITLNKHIRYSIDYPYFAIQHSKRDYLLFMETDYSCCYRGSVTICPSNVPIFSAQTKTCEMSLYFQMSAPYSLCCRQLIYDPQVPVFQKSGTLWIYYFSVPHPVTLQCRNVSGQTSYNKILSGAGLLHNTANCYISSNEIQVFPELHSEIQVKLEPSKFYLPPRMPIVTDAEIQKLEQIMPTELQKLDDIHSKNSGLQWTFDVDSILQLHHVSSRQDHQLHYYLIITASICVITMSGIIICYYHSCLHHKCYDFQRKYCSRS
jgi:hypothetical protein